MSIVPWKVRCYLDVRGKNPVEEFIERSLSMSVLP
jgi:hypothetical protein